MYKKFDPSSYLEQLFAIEKGKEPDQHMRRRRYWLIQKFEQILKKGLPQPKPDFEIPEGHQAEPLENLRKKYDDIAVHYANLYRGAYIFNYLGFALAIAIASGAFTVLYIKDGINSRIQCEYAADAILLLLGILKFWVIRDIISNTHDLKDNFINAKYIDFRYVSERIRFFVAYALLGKTCSLKPVSGGHLEQLLMENSGFRFYDEKVKHELDPLLKNLDHTKVNKGEAFAYLIQNQYRFHHSRAQRHRTFENKLKWLCEILNKCVKFIVLADIIIAIAYLCCCCWCCFFKSSSSAEASKHIMHTVHCVTPILVILTIIVPAVVAALVAITAQSEYSKLAARNYRLSQELQDFVRSYEEKSKYDLEFNQNKAETQSKTAEHYFDQHFDTIAQKLLDEVTEWTLIYEKEVHEM
jgi:hypothetical protein